MPIFSEMQNLERLNVGNCERLTSDDLEKLAALPKLSTFAFTGPQVTHPINFATFPALKVVDLGYEPCDLALQSLASIPNLESLTVSICDLTAPRIATIARLDKLQSLGIDARKPVTAAGRLAPLKALPNLTRIVLRSGHPNQIDDPALLSLAEIPSLKILQFGPGPCLVTDAGLARFRKLRPDVKIEGR
jgi:hypothetical protein